MSMKKDHEKKLKELGLSLPTLPAPAGAYVPAVRAGNLVFCSGQGPAKDGRRMEGRIGADYSLEEGQEAARTCCLNCLAEIASTVGSINRIKRIVKVLGFVNSEPTFHDQPKVMNGCSELLLAIFGEDGRHARSAIGTNNLPFNIPVEVEMVVEVED
jgi:enamine deaminase RidA (YjgF/YER057c/UK114 family)